MVDFQSVLLLSHSRSTPLFRYDWQMLVLDSDFYRKIVHTQNVGNWIRLARTPYGGSYLLFGVLLIQSAVKCIEPFYAVMYAACQ